MPSPVQDYLVLCVSSVSVAQIGALLPVQSDLAAKAILVCNWFPLCE